MSLIYHLLTPKFMYSATYRFIAVLFISLSCSWTATAASLVAKVDRQSLSIDETLTLSITSDQRTNDTLDVSNLEAQFDIINRQKNTQASIINGSVTVSTSWSFIIAPKASGQLLIPSFTINGVYSEAIKVTVTDSATATNNTPGAAIQGDVILQASVNKNQVYVQEQILLTLSLYYKTALSGYTAEDLTLDNVTLEEISEENFQKNIGGTRYNVLEKVYAIHPQASGTLNIPVQTWQVEKSINRFGFGRSTNPYLRVRSRPQTVEVKARPSNSQSSHWLPATNITLDQQWQQSILSAKVGEPLNYSLTISADGLSFSQLPSIPLNSDDFTIYTEQAKTNNIISEKGIMGTRTDNYAIIPKKAGTFTLPDIRLTWWDVVEDKEKTLTLPAQTIIVGNSALTQTTPEIPSIPNTPTSSSNNNASTPHYTGSHIIWIITTGIFAAIALFFLLAWWRLKQASTRPDKLHIENNAHAVKETHIKQIYHDIETAISAQQWAEVKQLLNQWAQKISDKKVRNGIELKRDFPELAPTLDSIDQQLYSSSSSAQEISQTINMENLTTLLEQLKVQSSVKQKNSPLKPLY